MFVSLGIFYIVRLIDIRRRNDISYYTCIFYTYVGWKISRFFINLSLPYVFLPRSAYAHLPTVLIENPLKGRAPLKL